MRKRNVTITIRCTEDERQRIYNMDCQRKIVQKLFSQRESLKLNRS